jgi:hypothetical protein
MTKQSIAELAYELWRARGCPHGSSEQDWLEAERLQAKRLAAGAQPAMPSTSEHEDEASIESFPASDPPASRIPDDPPSNADEKWAASEGTAPGRAPRR